MNADQRQLEKMRLNAALTKLRTKLYSIEELEAEERNKALLGKCFKFRNSYSSPSSEKDHWWLYLRVESVQGNYGHRFEFQVDKDGEISIKPRSLSSITSINTPSYIEITKAEFNRELKKVQRKIAKLS